MKKILAILFMVIIIMSAMSIAFADNPNRENGKYLGNNKVSIAETIYDCIILEEKFLSGKNKLEPEADISTVPKNQQIKQKQLDYFLENYNESLLENETALKEFQNAIASKEMNTGKNVKIDGQTFETNKTTTKWTEEGIGNITNNETTTEVNGTWTYTETTWYKFIFTIAGTSGQGSGTSRAPATGQDILLYTYEKMTELIKVFNPFETEDPIINPNNKTNETEDPIINPNNKTNETEDPIINPFNEINESNPINNYIEGNNQNDSNISALSNMKKTGIPAIAILLVLLSCLGIIIRKKQ